MELGEEQGIYSKFPITTPYTEQRPSALPRRVNISSQIQTPSHLEVPSNTTPIVKIRAMDYNLWFDGKDVERFIHKDKVLIQQKEFSKPKTPEKKRFEDESWYEVLKQVKDLTQKIKNPPQPEPQPRNEEKESVKEVLNQVRALSEAVNTPRRNWKSNQYQRSTQNNQPHRPRNPLPPFSSSYRPYIPAQMAPRPPLRCAYCTEEGHSATRFTSLAEDLDRRIVRTQAASYLFPNYWRVPMEGNESPKNKVRSFARTRRAQQEIYGQTCGQTTTRTRSQFH
ncbi:hypothetical protein O181_002265 [Austropuccinia psidii MF-1]|uniref:Uncharacterized protein n=1 Tax=Austropuccinia psidii MF-1 TaxID=1389203 RepID=A0A9Q3GCN4_9BASI|nr:hypothetical protein [Austropuccinia psidii MF-1]